METDREVRLGNFEWMATCGGFTPDVDDILGDRGYFGLVPEAAYLYGTFRTEDGQMHTPARRIPFGVRRDDTGAGADRLALGRRLALQSTAGSDDGHQHLDIEVLKRSASAADTTIDRGTRSLVVRAGAGLAGEMLLELSGDELHWIEDDVLDLSGRRVGSGLHWYLPGRDKGMYYTSQIYEVTGVIKGQRVSGFVPFDPVYMAQDAVLYAHHDVLQGEELCLVWHTWGTRWDDGTVEVGHTLVGHDRFGLCVATDANGVTVRTTDVEATDFAWSSDGYHVDRIGLSVAGEAWEFLAAPNGWQPDLGPVPNPQQEGLMQRVGETRKPVHWSSWGEANIAYGPPRRSRFRG